MRPINVVLAHHDPELAQGLADALRPHFRKVLIAGSLAETQSLIARFRAKFVIADLELLSHSELKSLCSEFPSTAVACVHRLADEIVWSEALAAGAVDCCLPSDVRGILLASQKYVAAMAAAA